MRRVRFATRRPVRWLIALAAVAACVVGAQAAAGGLTTRISDDTWMAYAEPEVAADPAHLGHLLAVSQAVPSSAPDGSVRQLVAYTSDDGGRSWSSSGALPGSTPDLLGLDVTSAFSRDGRNAYVLGEEQSTSRATAPLLLWRSRDGGRTFEAPVTVAPGIGHCCDHGWLRVARNGALQVVYTGIDDVTYATRSLDGGDHWQRPLALGAGLGPVVAAGGRSTVAAAWLGNGLAVRVSRNNGASFGSSRSLPGARGVNAIPAIAADPRTGRLYVAAVASNHALVWTSADGAHWSRPRAVGGTTMASQPQLAVGASGTVWTFLFDGDGSIRPVLATAPPALAGSVMRARPLTDAFPRTAGFGTSKGGSGGFVGDYQGLAADGRSAVAVWNDGRSGHLQLTAARVP